MLDSVNFPISFSSIPIQNLSVIKAETIEESLKLDPPLE